MNTYTKHKQEIISYLIYKLNLTHQDAEDVYQDVYIECLNKEIDNFKAFIFKACINRAKNYKTRNRFVELDEKMLEGEYEPYVELAVQIPELPEKQLGALMAVVNGQKLSQYAKENNLNLNTVKVNYNIAKKKIIEFNKKTLDNDF